MEEIKNQKVYLVNYDDSSTYRTYYKESEIEDRKKSLNDGAIIYEAILTKVLKAKVDLLEE